MGIVPRLESDEKPHRVFRALLPPERVVLPIPNGEVEISLMDLGKGDDYSLTEAESSDMMGLRERTLPEPKQEVSIVPWHLQPAQLINGWKLRHQKEIAERRG